MHLLQNTVIRVRTWMAKCISEHLLCSQMNSFAPTRLLDLSSTQKMATIKLSPDAEPSAGYVAPCYCWRKAADAIITTTSTISQWEHEIPRSRLPALFLVAIMLTRALGTRYLWVGSLCLYVDRYQRKHHRNLRFRPLFSEGFMKVLEKSVVVSFTPRNCF